MKKVVVTDEEPRLTYVLDQMIDAETDFCIIHAVGTKGIVTVAIKIVDVEFEEDLLC